MSSLLVGNGINNISNNINWKELLIDLMRSIDKENIINLDKNNTVKEAKEKLELLNKNDAEYIRLSTKLNFILS